MNMCPSNKRKLPPELCLKGQVFFIWSNYQSFEIVKDKISLLGGKVDIFLSKDVTTVLVEDTHLCGPQLISNDLTVNSSYVSNAVILSNLQYQSGLSNLPSTSRGFNLLASSSANSPYRIIGYARQWGIQVLGIYHFLTLIDQQVKSAIYLKKKTIENVSNLSGCFIKFESCIKKYRPCYKMFNNDPERLMPLKNAKLLVKPDTCNVILEKPNVSKQLQFNYVDNNDKLTHRVRESNVPAKAADKKPQTINKLKPKEENNYCECCKTHFNDLKQHIKSSKHQNFVSNEKNYESVHNILKMLPSAQEFIEKHQKSEINSELVFCNGDRIVQDRCPEGASAIDYSMPLNLHIKRHDDDSMPLNLHVEKPSDIALPLNLHIKKEEDFSMPLNLHVKREYGVKQETDIIKKENESLFMNVNKENPFYAENSVMQPKLELLKEEDMLVSNKLNKEVLFASEMPNAVPNEASNIDPLFDKTNTAALAQLCLKNFDSYWLDNLPCDMDDIMFDDNIFDLDDGKAKPAGSDHNECPEPSLQGSPIQTDIHTPGMVSGVSNLCLKTQSSTNTSLFFHCSPDDKDVNTKNGAASVQESYRSSCKVDDNIKALSPENIATPFNELPSNEKKLKSDKTFELKANVKSFYSETQQSDTLPSCSKAKSAKMSEQMFSSDSSDDENGNVFISNVLNIITYSDNEMKVDRDSCEEDSECDSDKAIIVDDPQYDSPKICIPKTCITSEEHCKILSKSKVNSPQSNLQSVESAAHVVKSPDFTLRSTGTPNPVVPVHVAKSSDFTVRTLGITNTVTPTPKSTAFSVENIMNITPTAAKSDVFGYTSKSAAFSVENIMHTATDTTQSLKSTYRAENVIHTEAVSGITDTFVYTSNSTFRVDTVKHVPECTSAATTVAHTTPKITHFEEGVSLGMKPMSSDVESMYEIKPVSCASKDMTHASEKAYTPAVAHTPTISHTLGAVKAATEVTVTEPNPMDAQYIARASLPLNSSNLSTMASVVPTKPNVVLTKPNVAKNQPGVSEQNSALKEHNSAVSETTEPFVPSAPLKTKIKTSHSKKTVRRIRKLPPLWSVSVVPGNGVRLKFTCIHPETVESEDGESDFSN